MEIFDSYDERKYLKLPSELRIYALCLLHKKKLLLQDFHLKIMASVETGDLTFVCTTKTKTKP